jgi:hypothetical protein
LEEIGVSHIFCANHVLQLTKEGLSKQLVTPEPKFSFLKHILDRGQENEEDVAGEGAEEDAVAKKVKGY